jgi:hypothetical protein
MIVVFAIAASGQCEYKTSPHSRQNATRGTAGHITGKHRAKARAEFTCQCEHSCRSNCNVTWGVQPICEDSGRISGSKVHRVYSEEKLRSGTKANALSDGGAHCGAAFGCFVEECVPMLCAGISISVKGEPLGVGSGVTFTGKPRPFWSAKIEIPFECEQCWRSRSVTEELRSSGKEYVPADEGGYGTGIGSVYRMCYWECESWLDSDGVYQEYCEVVECLLF